MCRPLFKKELRSGWKLALIFASVLALYTWVIITMFDAALGESLATMAESMPELFALFGMAGAYGSLIEFLSVYLYGFLYILVPLVWAVMLVNRLMARYVDRGAMAWLLSGPVSRRRLAVNQCAVLVFWLLAMTVYLTALELAAAGILFPGELDVSGLLRLNAGLLGLLLLLAAVCWLGSCIFNQSGPALGSGGGLCALFVLFQMLGNAGDGAGLFRFLTPVTLFDSAGLIAGNGVALRCAAVLYLGAAVLFAAGTEAFSRKDMSL